MNKYYTPTVEELIEYILSEKKIYWKDTFFIDKKTAKKYKYPCLTKFSKDNLIQNLYDFIESNDYYTDKEGNKTYKINTELFKIKYLDKEDIEELLKVPYKRGGSYIFEKEICFRPSWIIGVHIHKIRLYFHPDNSWVKIEYYLSDNTWEKFFEGTIKNKSGLAKLLTQIGINE